MTPANKMSEDDVRKTLNDLRARVQELEGELRDSEIELASEQEDNGVLQTRVGELEQKRDFFTTRVGNLEAELIQSRDQLQETRTQVTLLKRKLGEIKTEAEKGDGTDTECVVAHLAEDAIDSDPHLTLCVGLNILRES